MVIFHSYVNVYQRVYVITGWWFHASWDDSPRKDLMKMCEFLLSDPHEKSDAERLKNANKCMSRSQLKW